MNTLLRKKTVQIVIGLVVAILLFWGGYALRAAMTMQANNKADSTQTAPLVKTGYASVNDLHMYYEIHGTSTSNGLPPLVLLHGAFMNLHSAFDSLMPELSWTREVIAFDQQGHGRTADINRPISQIQMADDTAELLKQLHIKKADFFGWSMGGTVASQVALRHPEIVRKLATSGSNFKKLETALDPPVYQQLRSLLTHNFAPKEFKDAYDKIAPHPEQWSQVVDKLNAEDQTYQGISDEALRTMQIPTMIMVGDHDVIRPEHAVETYRQLPHGELAILPGTDHFAPTSKTDWALSMLKSFFAEPMPR